MTAERVAPFLLEKLREIELLEPDQLDELARLPEAQDPNPAALGKVILQRGWLTRFQVNSVANGRGKDLFIGPYLLLDRVGEGGMGQVYKAKHRHMSRIVALKVIRKEKLAHPDAVKRFYQEAQAAAQLSHPNIVLAYDAGQAGGTHYLAMEFVDGIDLARLVKEQGPLPVATACDYVRQAALGLQHAHERGMVHRDIKPHNLLVTATGYRPSASGQSSGPIADGRQPTAVVKILDMGLARLLGTGEKDRALTQTGAVIGTPEYLSPEQAVNSRMADIRSDLYSLGCTLYFLLTGKPPFQGESLTQILLLHQMGDAKALTELRPDVMPGLQKVVRKMIARAPDDRYQTPAEVVKALEPHCRGELAAAPVVTNRDTDLHPTTSRTLAGDEENPFAAVGEAEQTQELVEDRLTRSPDPERRPKKRSGISAREARELVQRRRSGAEGNQKVLLLAGIGGGAALLLLLLGGAGLWLLLGRDTKPLPPPPERPPVVQVPPQPQDLALRLLPVDNVIVKPGETSAVEVRVERRGGLQGPIDVVVEATPGTVRIPAVVIPADRDTVRLNVSALPNAQNLNHKALLVARAGAVTTAGPLNLIIRREGVAVPPPPPPPPPQLPLDPLGKMIVIKGEAKRFDWQEKELNRAVFSIDGKWAALQGNSSQVPVIDLEQRQKVQVLGGSNAQAYSAAVLPGGLRVLVCRAFGMNSVMDTKTGLVMRPLQTPGTAYSCVAAGPRHFITAHATTSNRGVPGPKDDVFRMWDAVTGQKVAESDQTERISRIACSAGGKRVIAHVGGQTDGNIVLWEPDKGPKVRTLVAGGARYASGLAVSDNGKEAIVIDRYAIILIDLDNDVELHRFSLNVFMHCVAFSLDGRYALVAGGDYKGGPKPGQGINCHLYLCDLSQKRVLARCEGHTDPVHNVMFLPDGRRALSTGDDKTIREWDLSAGLPGAAEKPPEKPPEAVPGGEVRRFEGHTGPVYAVGFSADGKQALSTSKDNTLRVWDVVGGASVRRTPCDFRSIHRMTFSPDGRYFLQSGTGPGRLWEVQSGQLVAALKERPTPTHEVAFSPDGKRVAVSGGDRAIQLWDTEAQKLLVVIEGHEQPVLAIAFSANGRQLLSAGADRTMRLWDAATGRELKSMNTITFITDVAISPDGLRALGTGDDGSVRLWDLQAGKQVRVFTGHTRQARQVAFLPGERTALSASDDGTLRLWDIESGKELHKFEGHAGAIHSLAVSTDGRRALTGGEDGTVRLWDVAR